MSEWTEVEFSKLLKDESISYGIVQPGPHVEKDSIPIIRVQNIKNGKIDSSDLKKVGKQIEEKHKKTRLVGGELLITVVGSVGECAIVPKEFAGWNVARAVSVARIIEDVDINFVRYSFATDDLKFQMYGNTNDTVQPTLNLKELKRLKLRLPKPSEQKAIASVLSSLDDKIDLLHRQNKTLEAMAETLFREWFVECSKDGFKAGYLSEFVEDTFGGDWGKEEPEDDYTFEVKCIRGTDIGDLQKGLAQKCPTRFVKESKFKRVAPRNGDLIIEISGGTEGQSTGRTIYVDEGIKNLFEAPLLFSNFCRLIRLKNPKHLYFVYLYISHLYEFGHFFNLQNGSSGIRNLDYKAFISEYPLMFPIDMEVIISFNELVKGHFVKINKNKTQIFTLESLRDTLLPKFMNGEIELPTDG